MRKKVTILFILLFFIAGYMTFHTYIRNPQVYQQHIEQAGILESKEIYEDAIEEYGEALKYQSDNWELKVGIARCYQALGEEKSFESYCLNELKKGEPQKLILDMLMKYYKRKEDEISAVVALKQILKVAPENEDVLAYYNIYRGSFEVLSKSYEEISEERNGYIVVKGDGKYGIIKSDLTDVIKMEYDWITPFSSENGYAATGLKNKTFYINENNYKKLVPDENYTYMGMFQNGYAPAELDGGWGYVDETLKYVYGGKWKACTNFDNDVAAVQQKNSWSLIDSNGESISDQKFDDVIRDEYQYCSSQKRIFAATGNKYKLYDTKGEVIGEHVFDDAKCFASEDAAAMKKDGKWGFVSKEGEIVIKPEYEDARSFSNGLAAVKKDGKWGYIDQENIMVIKEQFLDAKDMNAKGIAPVYIQSWTFIQLVEYKSN